MDVEEDLGGPACPTPCNIPVDTSGNPGTFYYSEQVPGQAKNVRNVPPTANFDSTKNETIVTWAASPRTMLTAAGLTAHVGFSINTVNPPPGSVTENINIADKSDTLTTESGATVHHVPVVNLSAITSNDGTLQWLIYTAAVTSGEDTVDQWFEYPLSLAGAQLTVTNPTGQSETLSSVEFFLNSTKIPIDQLNSDGLPPTDPRFMPVPGIPNGTVLGPGGSVSFSAVPEPASVTLLLTGVLALVGYCIGRRSTRSR